jgi:hypothetical protein
LFVNSLGDIHGARVPHRRLPEVRSPGACPARRMTNKEHLSKLECHERAAFLRIATLVVTIQVLLKWLVGIQKGHVEWEGASRAMTPLLPYPLRRTSAEASQATLCE